MKNIIIIAGLLMSVGCAHRVKLLNASAVSMTKTTLKKGYKVVEKGEVEGKFCAESFKQGGRYGLIDEAVKNAQKTHKVDYIFDAVVTQVGRCVEVAGTGMKIRRK